MLLQSNSAQDKVIQMSILHLCLEEVILTAPDILTGISVQTWYSDSRCNLFLFLNALSSIHSFDSSTTLTEMCYSSQSKHVS